MAKFLDGTGLSDLITKIKNAFVAKADTTEITSVGIDSIPTANSTNLVTSGGVKTALLNVVNKTDDETIGGTKTFTDRPSFNDSIFIDNSSSTASDHGVIITYDDETTLGVSGETERLTFSGPNDTILLSGLRLPESDGDAANKAYVDVSTRATRYEPTQETPYLAIRLGTTDQQSIFITAGADGVSSSFYVIPGDNDCVIIGDFDETDLEFSYADGVSDFGYNTALLISSNDGSSFNVFNLGSEKMDVKLTSSSGLEIGEFNGRILR